jgi:hypothetical protein
LIDRLAEEQDTPVRASGGVAADQSTAPAGAGSEATGRVPTDTHDPEQPDDRPTPRHCPRPPCTTLRRAELPLWPRLFAAAALLLCGLSYFPLHRDGASGAAYGFALGVSILDRPDDRAMAEANRTSE